MKKLALILIISVLIVALVIGSVAYFLSKFYNNPSDIINSSVEEALKICDRKSGVFKDNCINAVAVAHFQEENVKNGQICENIKDSQIKFMCIWTMSTANNNAQLCNKLEVNGQMNQDTISACIATANKNATQCNLVSNSQLKEQCLSSINKLNK